MRPFPSRRAISRWPTAIISSGRKNLGFIGSSDPIVLQLYSETLQKFRLAAQGHGEHQPPDAERDAHQNLFRSVAVLV